MHKDSQGNFIGNGEDAAFEILKELYPNFEIKRQVKFKDLLSGEWLDTITERQEKETIDIVIFGTPIIAVRVQDARHTGRGMSYRDTVQKKTLEWNNIKVVDLHHYECLNLMKNITGQTARDEIIASLRKEKVY